MSSTTDIEWTDATWNPVTGCTKITPGCDHCYAERFSERFRDVPGHPFAQGFDLTLRPERLEQPLGWRRPRRVFVNSMSDLFHKKVPWAFIDQVFDTMELADWHILGGPGWRERLDSGLSPGLAAEQLFRQYLKSTGDFRHVISTRVDRATSDRPQFSIVYGTKNVAGLKAFRETEHAALRMHAGNRVRAKGRKELEQTGQLDFLTEYEADRQEASLDDLVVEQKALARQFVIELLTRNRQVTFRGVVASLLERFMLRETNVKDVCVDLANEGVIENTWGAPPRKPRDGDVIRLRARAG